MVEIQKLKHLILVVIMPLLITNIAMEYNVSTDTTDITSKNRDWLVYLIHFSMHAWFLLDFFILFYEYY